MRQRTMSSHEESSLSRCPQSTFIGALVLSSRSTTRAITNRSDHSDVIDATQTWRWTRSTSSDPGRRVEQRQDTRQISPHCLATLHASPGPCPSLSLPAPKLHSLQSFDVYYWVYWTPVPLTKDAESQKFSEERALHHVRVLSEEIGFRQVSDSLT